MARGYSFTEFGCNLATNFGYVLVEALPMSPARPIAWFTDYQRAEEHMNAFPPEAAAKMKVLKGDTGKEVS